MNCPILVGTFSSIVSENWENAPPNFDKISREDLQTLYRPENWYEECEGVLNLLSTSFLGTLVDSILRSTNSGFAVTKFCLRRRIVNSKCEQRMRYSTEVRMLLN